MLRKKAKWLLVLLTGLSQTAWTQSPVILQNGTNNYTGCADVVINSEGASSITATTMNMKYEKCAS